MSSRLLRRTRTARPDNDLAARTWRIHDRMGAPPFWRNNDNVEVRPEIHDHSVETRRDSAVHPTQGRRYVQVRETGWKETVPPEMPFDVNRLHEPLVSMLRFWPNVHPDQPPLKFAAWFRKILDYMKHMDARHPETSAQFGASHGQWWTPSQTWHRGSVTEFANLLAEPKTLLPDVPASRTPAEERREWNRHADDHDCIIRHRREYTYGERNGFRRYWSRRWQWAQQAKKVYLWASIRQEHTALARGPRRPFQTQRRRAYSRHFGRWEHNCCRSP